MLIQHNIIQASEDDSKHYDVNRSRPNLWAELWCEATCRPNLWAALWCGATCRPNLWAALWCGATGRPNLWAALWCGATCRPNLWAALWCGATCRPNLWAALWCGATELLYWLLHRVNDVVTDVNTMRWCHTISSHSSLIGWCSTRPALHLPHTTFS